MQPAGVDAGLLVGFPQRGVCGTVVARVGRAARERGLACVVAQRRRTHGDQQVGIVGKTVGRWSRGPENSTSTAASRPGFAEAFALLVWAAAITMASTSGGTRRR